MRSKAIILRTDRGGKDPDTYWIAITVELWDILDKFDPWKTLGNFVDECDPRVLSKICNSRKEAVKGLQVIRTEYAIGY